MRGRLNFVPRGVGSRSMLWTPEGTTFLAIYHIGFRQLGLGSLDWGSGVLHKT